MPGNMPGNLPGAFIGGMPGAASRGSRAGRLALALLGALLVAGGFWLLGTAVLDAVLIPAGRTAYRLCSATCASRFAGGSITSLIAAALLLAFGGILRIVGRARI